MNRVLAKLHLTKRACANCKHFRPGHGAEVLMSNPAFHQITTAFTPDRIAGMQAEAAERRRQEQTAPRPGEDALETLGRVVKQAVTTVTEPSAPPAFSGEKWANLGVCVKHAEGVFPSYSCEDWT